MMTEFERDDTKQREIAIEAETAAHVEDLINDGKPANLGHNLSEKIEISDLMAEIFSGNIEQCAEADEAVRMAACGQPAKLRRIMTDTATKLIEPLVRNRLA